MPDSTDLIEAFDARVERRSERREFFRKFAGATAMAGGLVLYGARTAHGQAAPTDADILNFALNLEYLEAQFYSFAATGAGLPSNLLTGTGTQGGVVGGRKVNFTDPVVSQYAQEIAQDEVAHVAFLRQQLGGSAVAQPAIDVGGTDPNGAFSKAAQAAGLAPPGTAFDPYATDENFLLGAYIFEDVGVTAYKGAAPLITSKVFLEAAAGILAVEAYHASLIRTVLYGKGIATPAPQLIDATEKISDARDNLDGPTDLDQGVRNRPPASSSIPGPASNIAPLDENGLAYSRSAGQVLNIVYLNRMAVDRGGFFPAGVNGNIRTSAAS
jgi:hypothetical protein